MVFTVNPSAGVYVREIDLSQRIRALSTSIGGTVQAANKGFVGIRLVTSTQQYLNDYLNPDASLTFAHYTSLAFLSESDRLLVRRVINGALYGGMFVSVDATNQLSAPGAPTPVGSNTGGSLVDATYSYIITALDSVGETIGSTAGTVTLSGGTATQINTLTWAAVTGATGYRIYGRTGGSELFIAEVANVLTYIDTGAITPAGAIPVANTTSTTALTGWAPGELDPVNALTFGGNDVFAIYAINQGTWANGASSTTGLSITISDINTTINSFQINVFEGVNTVPTEIWPVTLVEYQDGYGRQLLLEERINALSALINVINNPLVTTNIADAQPNSVGLLGGTNGATITSSDIILGYDDFLNIEEVDVRILINGGYTDPAVQLKMDSVCQSRMDCIAVLDMPALSQSVTNAILYRDNTLNLNSSYSAIYTPDLKIVDPLNDITLFIPPSGHVAAVYAKTDRVRQTWFSPAGIQRGLLSVLGVREVYDQGERDALVEAQINPMRVIPGGGIAVWGDETMQSLPSALSNVNVRRLLIFIEKSISISLLFGNFEPGDQILRDQIRGIIIEFLDPIRTGRGLFDFDVVSDASNNPPQQIDEGILNVDVYLKPVIPAKRILLQAIILRTGASFKESVLAVNNTQAGN